MLNVEIDRRGIARVTMNRPEVHNAFNEEFIAQMSATFAKLAQDAAVRILVLTGAGKSFSAGADVNWMKKMASLSEAENIADAAKLADLLHTLNTLPKPTIARVNGACLGGGMGLVCAADIAIGAESAIFAVSEARLGLIPAVISPYVVAAMGERQARRYFQTAERFDAPTALRLGVLHQVASDLDQAVEATIESLLQGGPGAQAAAKALVFAVGRKPTDQSVRDHTAREIARQRASAEGREGTTAFLEKRKPNWIKE